MKNSPKSAEIAKITKFDDYQNQAFKTALFPKIGHNIVYPVLGLAGETGELSEKLVSGVTSTLLITYELGDIFWYLNVIATELGIYLREIAEITTEKPIVSFVEYENKCKYGITNKFEYTLRLNGEVGKLAEKIKKMFRDDDGDLTFERRQLMYNNLKSILWYFNGLASEFNISLSEIATKNIEKLTSRKDRGVLQGDGDER